MAGFATLLITCILANDEAVEKFKDPTKLELTCQGNPDGGYEAMVISMSGGKFSYFDPGPLFMGTGSNLSRCE